MKRRHTVRRTRKSPSQIRRSRLEQLENRNLLAAGPWYELTELTTSSEFQPGDGTIGVAASENTIVFGARNAAGATTTNSGKAYVYKRNDNGTPNDPGDDLWSLTQELAPIGLSDGDYFGHSVAMDGNTLVVGAIHHAGAGGDGFGAVYVYRRSSETADWGVDPVKITPDSYGGQDDRFGWSVDVEGDTIVVGAQRFDDADGLVDRGAAYVFRFDGNNWNQQRLLSTDGAAGDLFGRGVSINQGEIVIGAQNRGVGGAAYVFYENGGSWVQDSNVLQSSDVQAGDQFGWSVEKEGDTILVGAPRADVGSLSDAGAVYQYARENGQWTEKHKLTPDSGSRADEWLGRALAMDGNKIMLGTYRGGRAFILEPDVAGNWQETAELTASDPTDNDGFADIAVGNDFVVGLPGGHDHSGDRSGGAYVFVKDATRNREAYTSNDTPITLRDAKGRSAGVTTSEITIPDSGTIEDIDVRLNISHASISDLSAELVAPDGTTVTLFSQLADSGDDFYLTFFDDAADTSIATATAPFWGSFRPSGSLNDFNNDIQVGGTWQLRVSDHNKGTTGTLHDWLIVTKYKLPEPSFSIDDVTVAEGDSGTTTAQFTVTRSGNVSAEASVEYKTRDGDATAPADYVDIALTTLVFDAGETTKTIVVTINGDTLDEGDEAFYVDLSNASTGAIITKAEGVGTIQNDDAPAASTMFVADIDFKSRKGGREWRVEVLVHDENGIALEGVDVTITFAGVEYTGTTDDTGLARMSDASGNEWRTGLNKNTDYVAEVDSLMKSGYVLEQPALTPEFDHDGDGFYDEILRF